MIQLQFNLPQIWWGTYNISIFILPLYHMEWAVSSVSNCLVYSFPAYALPNINKKVHYTFFGVMFFLINFDYKKWMSWVPSFMFPDDRIENQEVAEISKVYI